MTAISALSSASSASTDDAITATAAAANQDFKFYVPTPTTDADNTIMRFGDFLDMMNPLQHIPVISEAYRAVTGDTISPVARIAGDSFYAGALGAASAGIAAAGAIADEAFAAANDGKGIAGTAVAALFGDDENPAAPSSLVAANTIPAAPLAPTPTVLSPSIIQPPVITSTESPSLQAGGLALDRAKPAYGGVMDSTMVQSAQQNQALALALAGNNGIIKAQHALANSRFMTSNPIPGSIAATDTTTQPQNPAQIAILNRAQAAPLMTPVPADADPAQQQALQQAMQPTPQTQQAIQGLMQELKSVKGIDSYRNAAQNAPATGSSINITN